MTEQLPNESRATVPDAATAANVQKMYERACDDIQEYSGAIERVRTLAVQHRSVEQHNEMVPMSDIADLIREPSSADYLAVLDGAPEPEWEYAAGYVALDGKPYPFEGHGHLRFVAEADLKKYGEGECILVRRRKAGPWLPVEGESK